MVKVNIKIGVVVPKMLRQLFFTRYSRGSISESIESKYGGRSKCRLFVQVSGKDDGYWKRRGFSFRRAPENIAFDIMNNVDI